MAASVTAVLPSILNVGWCFRICTDALGRVSERLLSSREIKRKSVPLSSAACSTQSLCRKNLLFSFRGLSFSVRLPSQPDGQWIHHLSHTAKSIVLLAFIVQCSHFRRSQIQLYVALKIMQECYLWQFFFQQKFTVASQVC